MRAKLILVISALVLILGAGCNKDEEGTLRITFTGSYNSSPLVMGETHDYANGQRIQISRAEYFISKLELIDGSGNAFAVSDIELIDLGFNNQSDATDGVVMTFSGIPAGRYNDLRFGIGVAPDINATVPADYPSSSPLSATDRYWIPWTSYIFSKTEGKLDTLVDATDNLDLGFAYHTGRNELYQPLSLGATIDIRDGSTTGLVIDLDYASMLGLPNAPLDIKAQPQNHGQDLTNLDVIVENYLTALTYYFE